MNHYKHSGKAGDLVYAIPIILELGQGILYIDESTPGITDNYHSFYKFMHRFCTTFLKTKEVVPYVPHKHKHLITHDLDKFRDAPNISQRHLLESYAYAMKLPSTTICAIKEKMVNGNYANLRFQLQFKRIIFNRTERYTTNFDWATKIKEIEIEHPSALFLFVGTNEEYLAFSKFKNKFPILNYLTDYLQKLQPDIYELEAIDISNLIETSYAVYCNQSLVLTLAQLLGKPYYLEVADHHSNCILNTPNEHLLNR